MLKIFVILLKNFLDKETELNMEEMYNLNKKLNESIKNLNEYLNSNQLILKEVVKNTKK